MSQEVGRKPVPLAQVDAAPEAGQTPVVSSHLQQHPQNAFFSAGTELLAIGPQQEELEPDEKLPLAEPDLLPLAEPD